MQDQILLVGEPAVPVTSNVYVVAWNGTKYILQPDGPADGLWVHAKVERDTAGGYVITDAGGRGDVYIGTTAIQGRSGLPPNQEVTIGTAKLKIIRPVFATAPASQPAPQPVVQPVVQQVVRPVVQVSTYGSRRSNRYHPPLIAYFGALPLLLMILSWFFTWVSGGNFDTSYLSQFVALIKLVGNDPKFFITTWRWPFMLLPFITTLLAIGGANPNGWNQKAWLLWSGIVGLVGFILYAAFPAGSIPLSAMFAIGSIFFLVGCVISIILGIFVEAR